MLVLTFDTTANQKPRHSMTERPNGTIGEVFSGRNGKPNARRSNRKREAHHRDEGQQIVAGIALRIRNFRKQQGLTLEELAERSKVSRAMISKVERSEKSPTLSVLVRIAKGLNITLSDLLGAEPDPAGVSIHRAKDRTKFKDPESGFERELLSLAESSKGLEIVLHRIPPGRSSGTLPTYAVPTEKYIIVQEGDLVVHLNRQNYEIAAGDTMHFEVKGPYSFSNPGQKTCVYYVVLVRRLMI